MNKELIDAAQAVVDRWDSPKWKDEAPTADFINRLRLALANHAHQHTPMPTPITAADAAMLAELMDNPPPPNEALTKAFERHHARRPPMPILTDAQLWDIAYAYGRKSAQDTVVPDLLRDWKTGMKSSQDVCVALFQHFSSTPTTG